MNSIKVILLVLFSLFSEIVLQAQTATENWVAIPDEKFFTYLKEKIPEAFSGNRMNANSPWVKNLNRINVKNLKIVNFKGLEHFENLEEFNCTYNLAEVLDLSQNNKLKYLVCWENKLKRLDLSGNPELLVLNCGDNKLTDLNISANRRLKSLHCDYNNITSLDLSNNEYLETLYINNNRISKIDISRNVRITKLETLGNPVKEVSESPVLVKVEDEGLIHVFSKLIPNALVGDKLNILHPNVINLKQLDISSSNAENVNLLKYFKSLEKLNCSNNRLTSLDLSENVFLTEVLFDNTPIKYLDLRGVRNLTRISKLATLKELKIHKVIRTNEIIVNLKKSSGEETKILIYDSDYNQINYSLINSNDNYHSLDMRY